MANHACVAIGINQYQFLPPLNYGQADAQGLWQFMVEEASLPPNQCLLLTDTSSFVNNFSTIPSRDNLCKWLETNSQTPHNSDHWRWFLFCGYGISWEKVDYLMPIDGNPEDIPSTGIPIRKLFESLLASGNQKILVLLDINRSPGLVAGAPVGAETVELAKQMGINLVLSSQLDQFSHEAAALGNGLFTTALLEALRYYQGNTTLEKLTQYISERLPELSQHHWRPIQTPLIIIPSSIARDELIVPSTNSAKNGKGIGDTRAKKGIYVNSPSNWNNLAQEEVNGTEGSVKTNDQVSTKEKQLITSLANKNGSPARSLASKPTSTVGYQQRQAETETVAQRNWWRQVLLWGSGALIIFALIAAVVIRNRESFIGQESGEIAVQTVPPSPVPILENSPVKGVNSLPADSENSNQQPAETEPSKPNANRLKENQAALNEAKLLIQPNQASLFSQAIASARKVKPGDPLYQEAQEDIRRWSQVILDLAEGRAKLGNFAGAIAAAKLIPEDNPSLSEKARNSLESWQTLLEQQKKNQAIIIAAREQVQPNQASSYNRAVTSLTQVPKGQPGYAEAQELISQASRTIYLIANSRAWRGKLEQAIETARLVPAGTPSHQEAQQAIARWEKEVE